jgi:AraC-like DNA-binding protein
MNKQKWIARELEQFRVETKKDKGSFPREVDRILTCISDHLFDPSLNVNLIRKLCGLKNNNVSTHFRWHVGSGIKEYIEVLRMRAAARLLRRQDIEVFIVAMMVGYARPETFCRAFYRSFSCTPLEFRLRSASSPGKVAVSRKEDKRIRQAGNQAFS